MDTTVGALKVGTQLVMGKYGVDKDSPHPIVWLKGNPNCDFITEKAIDYLCFDAAEETGHYRRVNNANLASKMGGALTYSKEKAFVRIRQPTCST